MITTRMQCVACTDFCIGKIVSTEPIGEETMQRQEWGACPKHEKAKRIVIRRFVLTG